MSDLFIQKSKNKNKTISKKYKSKTKDKKLLQKELKNQIVQQKQSENSLQLFDQIIFQPFKQEYYDETIDLLTDVFVNQEPICKSTNISFGDLRQFVEQVVKIGANLSSIAIQKYKDQEGNICNKVISAIISCDQADLNMYEQQIASSKVPQIQFILNLFQITEIKLNELLGINLGNIKKGQIIHQVLLGTHKNFQGMGVGFYLSLHNAQIVKQHGFQNAVMELTSSLSLKICKLLNIGKIIYSVKYTEIREDDKFREGFQQIEDRLLDEQISIYFIDTSDFVINNYEQYIKSLKFIF
ncbi:hypothetical protein ABPG74_015112 [Tetrahymena malaccensis]